MSLKDMLAEHVATFTNLDEFGDVHDIKYDGELYEDVPCTITRPKETDRDQTMRDHGQGIYQVTNRFHCARDAFNGVIPEHGTRLMISDGDFWREFYVVKAGADAGMINLDLEALDE